MKDKKDYDENKITGFFDKDTNIHGDLAFNGSFRIDGQFKGNISSESILIIGDNGKVEADIKIGYIIIDGQVKGNIQAKEKVEIHSNGKVKGTILSPKLIVAEGAFLEANCQTTDKFPSSSSQPTKPSDTQPPAKKENQTEPKP
jgi:cytoskeletal protein CcmA (bactofilin family)